MKQTGTIVKIIANKNYGHAEREDGSSIFVHASNFQGTFAELSIGDKIEFSVGSFQGRTTAKEIVIVKKAPEGETQKRVSRKQILEYAGKTANMNSEQRHTALGSGPIDVGGAI